MGPSLFASVFSKSSLRASSVFRTWSRCAASNRADATEEKFEKALSGHNGLAGSTARGIHQPGTALTLHLTGWGDVAARLLRFMTLCHDRSYVDPCVGTETSATGVLRDARIDARTV